MKPNLLHLVAMHKTDNKRSQSPLSRPDTRLSSQYFPKFALSLLVELALVEGEFFTLEDVTWESMA